MSEKDKDRILCPLMPLRIVVPAELEKWLEQRAQHGWSPDKVNFWSCFVLTLRRGEQKKYKYVADLRFTPDDADYISAHEAEGFEYLGRMSSLSLWRREYGEERPAGFTDPEKREKRCRAALRVSTVLLIVMFLLAFFVTVLFIRDMFTTEGFGFLVSLPGIAAVYMLCWYLGRLVVQFGEAVRPKKK